MSWKSLAPHKLARGDEVLNYLSIQSRDIQFRLDKTLIAALGWKVGDRVDVKPGEGEHAGKVRIEKNPRGWMLHSPGGKRTATGAAVKISIKLGKKYFPKMPDACPRTFIDMRVVDNGIEFVLPWIAIRDPARPFAGDNLTMRSNGGNGKVSRPATYVGTIANS